MEARTGVNGSTSDPTKRRRVARDIGIVRFDTLKWGTPEESQASVYRLYEYAEGKASDAISWYLGHKNSKSRWSRWLRITAIILATFGGLAPVILSLGWLSSGPGTADDTVLEWSTSAAAIIGQLGYLWLALAAACVAVDKFFGFSSGWMRYIKTAQAITRALSDFRMDWAMMLAKLEGKPPTGDQIQLMIQRLKEFVALVDTQVEQETLTWIAEFQTSLAEIEKTTKAQEEATKPGAIEVTVTNGMDMDEGFVVALDGMTVAHVRGTKHQIGYVPPGPHRISVLGTRGGKRLDASELVNVTPGAIAKLTLAMPVEEAQP